MHQVIFVSRNSEDPKITIKVKGLIPKYYDYVFLIFSLVI